MLIGAIVADGLPASWASEGVLLAARRVAALRTSEGNGTTQDGVLSCRVILGDNVRFTAEHGILLLFGWGRRKRPCLKVYRPRIIALPGAIIRTMNVLMYCPTCKKQVRVGLLNAPTREKLKSEIESGAPVHVMHTDADGDHIWTLSAEETADLGKRMKQGLV